MIIIADHTTDNEHKDSVVLGPEYLEFFDDLLECLKPMVKGAANLVEMLGSVRIFAGSLLLY